MKNIQQAVKRDIIAGDYVIEDGDVILTRSGARATGRYIDSINGVAFDPTSNIIVAEGLLHLLAVTLGATSKNSAWYVGLYSGAISPTSSWTAANFTATATEITSNTEGYSQATRPVWTPGTPAAGTIDNLASEASFSILCASSITVNGAAVLSSSVKGGTTGVLMSAARYGSPRVLYSGDTYKVGYEITLTG